MGELLEHMNTNCKNEWSGRVWLDVEGAQYWLGNFADNQAYYKVSGEDVRMAVPQTADLNFFEMSCNV